jgi:hypothetical protein
MPLKNNLQKIGKYLEEGASNVAVKSGSLLELSKLSIDISSEEKVIREIYEKIGEKIYKDYTENKITDKNLIDKCEEIEHIKKNISSLKKKVIKLKDKKLCKKCGAEMDKKDMFCPKCGKEQKT